MCEHYQSQGGLVTLSPKLLDLKSRIDACFMRIAERSNASAMLFPPMIPVSDADRLDYFVNFPHLPLAVSLTNGEQLHGVRKETTKSWVSLNPNDLQDAAFILPPAACYATYSYLSEKDVGDLSVITTVANCFRNEHEYIGLKRLKGFTMREVVLFGNMETVTKVLNNLREEVILLAQSLDLSTSLENATDPFFDPNSSRATAQKVFPVKQELVYKDGTAISSANFHRNFFGERFNIRSNNDVAYTACIGMGLERWIHALMDTYKNDVSAASSMLDRYLESSK